MEESLKPPYLQKDDTRGDYQVWIVDGAYIRGHIDEEFTNFGQHYRFPYIPENELWLDREAQLLNRDSLVELGAAPSLPLRDIALEVHNNDATLGPDRWGPKTVCRWKNIVVTPLG